MSDTRYAQEPANRRGNVFSNIVQPMPEHRHSVQAEVHARSVLARDPLHSNRRFSNATAVIVCRKRRDSSAYTILVNNMRLMAILDWWEAANQFIMQPPPPPADADKQSL